MELKQLRVVIAGDISNTRVPPWVTKMKILNGASHRRLKTSSITQLTNLKFLLVESKADWDTFSQLTALETLILPKIYVTCNPEFLAPFLHLKKFEFISPSDRMKLLKAFEEEEKRYEK